MRCLVLNIAIVLKNVENLLYILQISLLTETIDLNISIIKNKDQIDLIVKKIEGVYKDVKKHEESINVDYLLNGIEKSNLEKTVERLEKNEFDYPSIR